MIGNNVSAGPFQRTIVCLNARRETRVLTLVTNQSVIQTTNLTLNWSTNITFTLSTNRQFAFSTNQTTGAGPIPDSEQPVGDAMHTASERAAGPGTNITVSTAHGFSVSRSGNQTLTSISLQRQRSVSATGSESNAVVALSENEVVSVETNLVVTVTTNVVVNTITNTVLVPTNLPLREYYLVVEYTPPPDFTLQSGESLVLIVDGVRHALVQATTRGVLEPRRGFAVAAYRASPQLFVDIANAKEVKLRLKGNNAVIEKTMSPQSRTNFRNFLLKHFASNESAPQKPTKSQRKRS